MPPPSLLPPLSGEVRPLTDADLPAVAALYDVRAAAGNGLLVRDVGRTSGILQRQDVALVVTRSGGTGSVVTGYAGYRRERGYHGDGELHLQEVVAADAASLAALLGSLRSWEAVVASVLWRGAAEDLALAVPGLVPAPSERQPWSLRVLDPVAAVAARGFSDVGHSPLRPLAFSVAGRAYRLELSAGRGELVQAPGAGGPSLTWQGLALLYAGRGDLVHRHGHSDQPLPDLAAAFAGPVPEILDYF